MLSFIVCAVIVLHLVVLTVGSVIKMKKIEAPKQRAEKKINLNATLEKLTGLKSQGETE